VFGEELGRMGGEAVAVEEYWRRKSGWGGRPVGGAGVKICWGKGRAGDGRSAAVCGRAWTGGRACFLGNGCYNKAREFFTLRWEATSDLPPGNNLNLNYIN
jgi:hypothetical protein